ncbi:hypothetical protein [Nocardia australiensis]|uniref:hypothetical protein n=1 Tax=Nocardia australiensis TaxID=2887191 RepID=UPI001D154E2E|nr:hypothetical protein [Nocardia australiensis]
MGDKVEVNPELVRQAAGKTAQVQDGIAAALTTLEATLNSLGTPWGDDRYGQQFADGQSNDGYRAARANLAKITANLAGSTGHHSETQTRSGRSLADQEQANTDDFR